MLKKARKSAISMLLAVIMVFSVFTGIIKTAAAAELVYPDLIVTGIVFRGEYEASGWGGDSSYQGYSGQYIEVFNTTDQPINLKNYEAYYAKSSQLWVAVNPITKYSDADINNGKVEPAEALLPAHSIGVIWIKQSWTAISSDTVKNRTSADFAAILGINEECLFIAENAVAAIADTGGHAQRFYFQNNAEGTRNEVGLTKLGQVEKDGQKAANGNIWAQTKCTDEVYYAYFTTAAVGSPDYLVGGNHGHFAYDPALGYSTGLAVTRAAQRGQSTVVSEAGHLRYTQLPAIYGDGSAPVITHTQTVTEVSADNTAPVTVSMYNAESGLGLSTVELFHRKVGAALWTSTKLFDMIYPVGADLSAANLKKDSGDLSADIPASAFDGINDVEYYIKATDVAGNYSDSPTFTISASSPSDAPVIINGSLPNGVTGVFYSEVLLSYGIKPIAWAITGGTLPAGLTLNGVTGAISGKPTSAGTFTFTVEALNEYGKDAKEYTIFIDNGSGYVKAEKGLWITEIFHNDVNDGRNGDGNGDRMEFVEIVNTSDNTIVFNETYTFWYEYISNGQMITQAAPLTVTCPVGVPAIGSGETVVIRLARSNSAAWFPSDEDFRTTLDVKPGVQIWLAAGQNGWAENGRGCSIRLKDDKNTILSRYLYNFTILPDGTYDTLTDDVSADGLSVSLQIPDFGYEMLTWEKHTIPTPGYVYNGQYNGQKVIVPEISAPEGLFITEILPQDSTTVTRARFGSEGNQILEFVELTNTTDRDIDLNKEYQLTYGTKINNGNRLRSGGNDRVCVITQPEDPYNDTCIIPAGKSVVIWIHREESNTAFLQAKYGFTMAMLTQRQNAAVGVTTVYDTWPTIAEFREIRGIAADIPVFTCRNINGLGNDRNFFALRKIVDTDAPYSDNVLGYKTELVSTYMYYTSSKADQSGGRSVALRVSPEGPTMALFQASAVPHPGIVDPAQLIYLADDGKTPVIREWDTTPVPASIDQGSIFRTPYYYENAKSMEVFYRASNSDSFVKVVSTSFPIFNKWYTFIPADVLLHADYFDYYIKAKGMYRSVQTDMKRVYISKINDETGFRVSLNGVTADNSNEVSGILNITAKNFADTATPVTMTLDGNNLPAASALEKGAFFTFTHDGGNGIDAYFKNALVVKAHEDDDYGEIIKLFPQYSEVPGLESQAILVDGRYFTYNPDGSASIDLYIYAGTHGSTFESFTAENNDDFTAQWIRLSLPDGTTFKPTEYKGFRVTTGPNGAGTEKLGWFTLDPDARVSIGDSNNMHIYVKASFTVPATLAKLDAYAAEIDTTALSDGAHTLTVTSGSLTRTITLNVDNSVPVPPAPEQFPATDLSLALDASKNPVTATVTAKDGDANVAVYEAKQAEIKVFEGVGDSTAAAVEKSDNGVTVSANGEFPYQIYELTVEAAETDSLRFDITAVSDYNRDVQMYALNVETNTWELLKTTRSGDDITAIFPLVNRIDGDKVQVLVQARSTEFAPYTEGKAPAAEKNNYSQEWTGEGEHSIPKQYDFSIAWITDTQYYMEQYTWQIDAMTDWIIANRDELNIQYVTHTGDIVDEWDEEYQWINASNYLKKLEDKGIPYGVLAGNHDVAHGAEKYDSYWQYFGEDRYNGNIWYGGSYKNNLGHYDLITVDGVEIIFVYMSWDMYYPELNWINGVLAEYSDRLAIIALHPGLNASAVQSYHGNLIMGEVAAKNKNVIAVINGHYHGSSLNFVGYDDDGDGIDDRVVYQICTDYQSAPEGGSGYIKMLYFDLANGKIYINSYSPSLDDYNYYDMPKLTEYSIGLNIYNIDITMLSVDFGRETVKTLIISDAEAFVLTSVEFGAAEADDVTEITFESEPGIKKYAYATASDASGKITAYSKAEAFTVAKSYTVTFVDWDGTLLDEQFVEEGNTAVTPADPIKDGYTFLGWYLGGEAFDFGTAITEDIMLTAMWEEEHDAAYCEVCGEKMVFGEVAGDCYANGYSYYACDCGEWRYVEIFKTMGHILILVETRPATCEHDGAEFYVCDKEGCNHWEYGATIPALGHDLKLVESNNQWFNVCQNDSCGYWEYANAPTPAVPTITGVSSAKFISIDPSSNKTVYELKFSATVAYSDGSSKVVQYSVFLSGNNANQSGSYKFGASHDLAGYTLTYDIKGNGSNIKEFKLTK